MFCRNGKNLKVYIYIKDPFYLKIFILIINKIILIMFKLHIMKKRKDKEIFINLKEIILILIINSSKIIHIILI